WYLALAVAGLGPANGATFLEPYANTTNGISLSAGFVPDAQRVMVGEPLFLTFVVSNRGERPFQFDHVRNEIFTVTATNAAGVTVKSRYFGMDGNGPMAKETVAPGQSWGRRIFMNERCVFDEPGEYMVSCRCDFGHFSNRTNALGKTVVTLFGLTVLPADPKRIPEVIAKWAWVVETNGEFRAAAGGDTRAPKGLDEAAQALAEINNPGTIRPLAALVAKQPGNYLAVNALARFTNDAAADALMVVLQHGEDYVSEAAGNGLRKAHQHDRIARALLPMLTDPDPNLRTQGARAVSWTHSELAFAPLCSRLQDESNSVRYAAADAIGRLGHASSFAVLTNCLTNSDFTLRIAAIKGLRALGRPVQPEWVKPMILGGGENIRSYYDAIDFLRMYGGNQAAPGLASCLHFDDPSVKNSYNFRLILALEFSPNGPKHYYQWHHVPNRDGTEQELADNRRILSDVKSWLAKYK